MRKAHYRIYISDMALCMVKRLGIGCNTRYYDIVYGDAVSEPEKTPEQVKADIMAEFRRIGGEVSVG